MNLARGGRALMFLPFAFLISRTGVSFFGISTFVLDDSKQPWARRIGISGKTPAQSQLDWNLLRPTNTRFIMRALMCIFASCAFVTSIAAIPSRLNPSFPSIISLPDFQQNTNGLPARNLTFPETATNLTWPNPDAITCYSPRKGPVDMARCASIFDFIAAGDEYYKVHQYDQTTRFGLSRECSMTVHPPRNGYGADLGDELLLASAAWILAACGRYGSGGEKLVGKERSLLQIKAPSA